MKISWLGTAWAAVKGFFTPGTSAQLAIVDYMLDTAYGYYSSVSSITENISRTHSALVTMCDRLDYYAKYVPTPWMSVYDAIRESLGALRDCLADGKIEFNELSRITASVRFAIYEWKK